MKSALDEHPDLEVPRFIRYFLRHRGEAEAADFQEFLQRARLSSHTRIAAQRPA